MDEELIGVYIELDKTDLPPDARTHDPAKLDSLAADMKENRQLQEIVVAKNGDRYEVVAGVGRVLAARKLGWAKIRASVREGLSELQKHLITYSENSKREDADPFYQAAQLQTIMKEGGFKNQRELAKHVGEDEADVSRILTLANLKSDVQEKLRRLNFSQWQLVQILRLEVPEDQIKLAQECHDKDLSVRQLKALVDQKLGKPAKEGEKAANSAKRTAESFKLSADNSSLPLADPLADFWPELHSKSQYLTLSTGKWGLSFGRHEMSKTSGGKSIGIPAWTFWVTPAIDVVPKAGLKKWFQAMADAMGDTSQEEARAQRVMSALRPSNKEELPRYLEERKHIRLAETPADWSEIEALAPQGPSAVYGWIYGPNSLIAQKAKALTWQDLGDSGPVAEAHKLLDGLKQAQAALSQINPKYLRQPESAAAPVTPTPSGGMGDEEAARRVAALKAKFGRVL